jgi:hypothetical protein
MGVESGNVPKAVAVVERLLHRIAETGPGAREHAIAVRQAVGQCRRDAEDPWQLTIDLALRGSLDPSWTPESEQAALQQVTPRQVRAAAARVAETLKVTVRT